jgi:hypothetical protein
MIGTLSLLRRAAPAAILAALAAIPTHLLVAVPVICVWRTFLHLECPGCGMTRALSSALHGHLSAAVACNRGVVIVLPAALIVVLQDLYALCFGDSLIRAFRDYAAGRVGGVLADAHRVSAEIFHLSLKEPGLIRLLSPTSIMSSPTPSIIIGTSRSPSSCHRKVMAPNNPSAGRST